MSGRVVRFSSPAKRLDFSWEVQLDKRSRIEVLFDKRPRVPTEITVGRYRVTLSVERLDSGKEGM